MDETPAKKGADFVTNPLRPLPPIAQPLIKWYKQNARPLPWRDDPTPYRVWVSEIMLQQTRIEAARGYFERFMAVLPDVFALAAADEDEVMKLWEGLGYYSRARNLHKAAKLVVSDYGGALPAEAAALRSLPGIGDYTAGAIASIAFGLPEPAVDGNVLRICARLCACGDSIGEASVKNRFRDALRAQYETDCGAFSSALMELGETICLPGTPDCERCPIAASCAAHERGRETDYPVMPAKKPRRVEEKTVLLLRCGEKTALCRRPDKGLLAGLWELPNRSGHMDESAVRAWCARKGLAPRSITPCGESVHIFSHIEWHMTGFAVDCGTEAPDFEWTANVDGYALPTAFRYYRRQIGSIWQNR